MLISFVSLPGASLKHSNCLGLYLLALGLSARAVFHIAISPCSQMCNRDCLAATAAAAAAASVGGAGVRKSKGGGWHVLR